MSVLLNAFKGTNKRVPVWFMRQAGRYLPQYRALKARRALNDMFRDPDTAAEITLQPIDILGVDAAIIFADILTLPAAMGFKIDYIDGRGPVVDNPITGPEDIERIHDFDNLDHVAQTIKKVNSRLSPDIPLIGFAGAPYTVLTYLCPRTTRLIFAHEQSFHAVMEKLTDNTIACLRLQKKCGIKVFQLFDTWGGSLRSGDYRAFVLPYVQRIFKEVDLPSIYYLKNCAHLFPLMPKSGADFVSVCETVHLNEIKTARGIQGNLFNGLLYADDRILIKETR
ncbi:MAG: uroporphyrinogen decarboxylase, partial [Candidatus Omnitrophica bacterium]|nr:uroporphyrinogen decarboxylase [Candidatus Omnitrophota bacterium]